MKAGVSVVMLTYPRLRMFTTQVPPVPPTLWVSPSSRLELGTWRGPASPRSWWKVSITWATPEAPTGWPLAFRPPDVLMGRSPVRAVRPSSTARGPSPGSKKPRSSVAIISAMVKQSWTSATWMSWGVAPAMA